MPDKHDMNSQTDYLEKLGYEARDVSVATVARSIAYLFVFLIVTAIGTVAFYNWAVPKGAEEKVAHPLSTVREMPPAPVIQAQPRIDIRVFRVGEDARLNSYGWADPKKETPRMPVDKAMDIVAQQGLPTRNVSANSPDAAAPVPARTGLTGQGEIQDENSADADAKQGE